MKQRKPCKPCMIKGCGGHRVSRGLCHACYQAAWLRIRDGRTTWEELVELGLALPTDYRTRKNPLVRAFESRKEER